MFIPAEFIWSTISESFNLSILTLAVHEILTPQKFVLAKLSTNANFQVRWSSGE